jgi:hypothetical protein
MDKLNLKEKIEMRKKAKFHGQNFKPCSSVSKVLG